MALRASPLRSGGRRTNSLSFYSSEEVVAQITRSAGDEDFESYAKRKGLFRPAFGGYLDPIERHWQPYLDGEADISIPMHDLDAEISSAED